MCIVCDSIDKNSVLIKEQDTTVAITKNKDGEGFWLVIQNKDQKEGHSVLIKYCPWCGSSLVSKYFEEFIDLTSVT